MEKRLFTLTITASTPSSLDGQLSEELSSLQADGNEIIDIKPMMAHGAYVVMIIYAYTSKDNEVEYPNPNLTMNEIEDLEAIYETYINRHLLQDYIVDREHNPKMPSFLVYQKPYMEILDKLQKVILHWKG